MLPIPSLEDLLALAVEVHPRLVGRDSLEVLLHSTSPRVRFLKNLPLNATLLDLGAGEGSTVVFKDWLKPKRTDLNMYALSLSKGAFFDRYDGYALADFETSGDLFPGVSFDAIFTANFVEHIEGGIDRLAPWAAAHLSPGGMFYVEAPGPNMELLPHTDAVNAAGFNVSTMNFFDDKTHRQTATLEKTRLAMEAAGFFVEESGYWRNRYIEDEVLRTGFREKEPVLSTFAIWMKCVVQQYVVAVKA